MQHLVGVTDSPAPPQLSKLPGAGCAISSACIKPKLTRPGQGVLAYVAVPALLVLIGAGSLHASLRPAWALVSSP